MSSNYVVINDGVDYGLAQGQLAPFVQGEVGKVITIDVQDLAGIDFDITGATINSTTTRNTGTGDVTAVSGTVAVSGGGLTWTLSADDCGTAGRYTLIVKFTLSAKVYKTFPVLFDILEDPTVTASQNPGVTGVSELEAAWLTAEKAAIEAADDGEILQSDGTNSEGTNYLTATSLRKNNYTATAAPGVGDDTADGYAPGSEWIDVTNDKAYVCLDATLGAAVWTETTASGGGLANIVEDTTPQLGGNLDLNGNVITGLVIGTNVQAYDAGLTDLAGLAVTDGNIPVGDGANWVAESGATVRASIGALPAAADIVAVASSRDIAASDGGKLLTVTATAALNCPNGLGTGLQCAIASHGGTTTITAATTLQYLDGGLQTAASGVTVNTQCTLVHMGSNVWTVYGDVTPI